MKVKAAPGYTIVEVLIFLLITGFMFATATLAVGGYQRNIQYSQAVRDFELQIKDVINDVRDGYYPDYSGNTCTATGAGGMPVFGAGTASQGSNDACINIGKSVMFNLSGHSEEIGVATVVGRNPGIDADSLSLSLSSLMPTSAYESGVIDLTTYKSIRYGAVVTKIARVNNPSQTYSSLSFISSFTGNAAAVEARKNGTLSIDVYGFRDSSGIDSAGSLVDYKNDIQNLASNGDRNPSDGFFICLSTNNDRRARIIVGVDGVATATKTEFDLPESGGPCP